MEAAAAAPRTRLKNVSFEEIKKKYKQLAMVWHPDKFDPTRGYTLEEYDEKFKKIGHAYDLLRAAFENQNHKGEEKAAKPRPNRTADEMEQERMRAECARREREQQEKNERAKRMRREREERTRQDEHLDACERELESRAKRAREEKQEEEDQKQDRREQPPRASKRPEGGSREYIYVEHPRSSRTPSAPVCSACGALGHRKGMRVCPQYRPACQDQSSDSAGESADEGRGGNAARLFHTMTLLEVQRQALLSHKQTLEDPVLRAMNESWAGKLRAQIELVAQSWGRAQAAEAEESVRVG